MTRQRVLAVLRCAGCDAATCESADMQQLMEAPEAQLWRDAEELGGPLNPKPSMQRSWAAPGGGSATP